MMCFPEATFTKLHENSISDKLVFALLAHNHLSLLEGSFDTNADFMRSCNFGDKTLPKCAINEGA